jgi:protein gp37
MAESSIEWTDVTWNPVAGCAVISAGCTNCYAMRMAARLDAMGVEKYKALTRKSGSRTVWTGDIRLDESALQTPLKWSKPRMVFVNSMSDLFHEKVPTSFIEDVWAIMARAQQHTFQILTKRTERMAEISSSLPLLPNVWLGTSVESAEHLWRLDALRRTRATIRFASFEPLLGSVQEADLSDIGWAIVGGESGPGARPMKQVWVREIRKACRTAGTAFFFKQWGGTNKKRTGRKLEGKTWDEFPVTHSSEYGTRPCALAQSPSHLD